MLEKDFNELDNDFVTIWSNYLVYPNEYYTSPKGLEELAILGQTNAIQSVLLFDDDDLYNNSNLNFICDNILYLSDKNYEPNFNEELIIQNAMRRIRCTRNQLILPHLLVRENLSNTEHLKIVLEKHKLAYIHSTNPLILQRYYEIKKGHNGLCSNLSIKKLREELQKIYILNPENVSYAFAYAKNLYFFGNKNDKELGKNILKKLANRELSQTLKNNIKNTKTNITTLTT